LVFLIFFPIMSYKWSLLDGPVSGLRNFITIYTLNHKFRVKWVPFHYDKLRVWRWRRAVADSRYRAVLQVIDWGGDINN
jgi:hypothetical protein